MTQRYHTISTDQKAGREVQAQAADGSVTNTEPVMLRSTITGVIGAVLAVLVLSGVIGEDEKKAIEDQAGIIVPALLLLAPVIAGIFSRLAAYSPRSAARIAVTNAGTPAGSVPVLDPPP